MIIESRSAELDKRDPDLTERGLIVAVIVLALIAAVPVLGAFLSGCLGRM